VEGLYATRLGALADAPRLALPPGESTKTLSTVERVLDLLAGAGLGRDSLLVTLGGGVTSDLGGLAASLYMRGVAVVHCPTTLLAQVDAAIGGKTAVNLRAGKNLAGTFHQPLSVLCDTDVLGTLDDHELASGLGEVVKSALLGAPGLLERLEHDAARLVAREPEALAGVVEACVRLKAGIVASDEREGGPRRSLNLGHTFAHAIEHAAGYGRVPHGVAVAVGIVLALEASRSLGRLEDADLPARVAALLGALGLPASLAELRRSCGRPLGAEELERTMELDKKVARGEVRLVLPRGVGRVDLDVRPSAGLLAGLLAPS
jgi:3-dehydroquinate synthase